MPALNPAIKRGKPALFREGSPRPCLSMHGDIRHDSAGGSQRSIRDESMLLPQESSWYPQHLLSEMPDIKTAGDAGCKIAVCINAHQQCWWFVNVEHLQCSSPSRASFWVVQLSRDRLQLKVTQPGKEMKLLPEYDATGREVSLQDLGLTGPGLHKIWVLLRLLPLAVPANGSSPPASGHISAGKHAERKYACI